MNHRERCVPAFLWVHRENIFWWHFSFVYRCSSPLSALADGEFEKEGAPIYVNLSTGLDFSRGDYGLDEKNSLYNFPFGVTFDDWRFRVRAALPILVGSGPNQINESNDVTKSGQTRGIGQLQLGFS
jgi:hypothetical protein